MSKNLEKVIQRAISDAAFRRQLQSDPEAALRGFKLTESEVAALRSGDAGRLTSLGIDQRMSKTFSFGGDSLASRAAIGGDLTSGAGMSNAGNDPRMDAALEGGNTSGATRNVIPTEAGGSTPAFDPGVTGNATSVGDPMFDGRATSVIADPDNPASARTYTGGQAARFRGQPFHGCRRFLKRIRHRGSRQPCLRTRIHRRASIGSHGIEHRGP
jgi:hypothetical protein